MASKNTGDDQTPSAVSESRESDLQPQRPGRNDLVYRDGFPSLLGADGPLVEGIDPIPRQPFASYRNALKVYDAASLLKDCRTVFSARTRDDDAAYSAGQTYFCPCAMKPRCALEALALEIFQTHTKGLEGMYNPEQSGAEWWTLVLEAGKTDDSNGKKQAGADSDQQDDDENEDDEVGMHFDADYGLEAQASNLLLHPRVATVTYLSNVGAPTLILDKTSPSPSDESKQSLNGSIRKGWLSGPQFGKHVAFDGRLLHGAPALFFPGNEQEDSKVSGKKESEEPAAKRPRLDDDSNNSEPPSQRVTFLVNVWLNHCPLDAELLEDEVVQMLETKHYKGDWTTNGGAASSPAPFVWNLADLSKLDETCTISLQPDKVDPAGSDEVVICNRLVKVEYNPTMNDLHAASKQTAGGKSVELLFESDTFKLVVGDEVEGDEEEEGDSE